MDTKIVMEVSVPQQTSVPQQSSLEVCFLCCNASVKLSNQGTTVDYQELINLAHLSMAKETLGSQGCAFHRQIDELRRYLEIAKETTQSKERSAQLQSMLRRAGFDYGHRFYDLKEEQRFVISTQQELSLWLEWNHKSGGGGKLLFDRLQQSQEAMQRELDVLRQMVRDQDLIRETVTKKSDINDNIRDDDKKKWDCRIKVGDLVLAKFYSDRNDLYGGKITSIEGPNCTISYLDKSRKSVPRSYVVCIIMPELSLAESNMLGSISDGKLKFC